MKDSVYHEGIQCDGAEHDGCEAGCLIFWKEADLSTPKTMWCLRNVACPSKASGKRVASKRHSYKRCSCTSTSTSNSGRGQKTSLPCVFQATDAHRAMRVYLP
jgi:hypothetical protein